MIFNTLSIFTTLALGAFASAVPLSSGSPVSGLTAVPHVDTPAFPSRRDGSVSVIEIVQNVTTNVQPYIEELKFITAANATLDSLTPIVVDIKTVLADAIISVQGLAGEESTTILGLVGGVVATVADLAEALSALIISLLQVVTVILGVVTSDLYPGVAALLGSLIEVVGCLVCCIVMSLGNVVSGLIGALVPLLSNVLGVLSQIDVVLFVKVLGITI